MKFFNEKKKNCNYIQFILICFHLNRIKNVPAISNFISLYFTRNYDVPDGIN